MTSKNCILLVSIFFIFAIILLLFFYRQPYDKFDLNNLVSVIGVFITSLAFLVGSYFALLAVSAYSHIKDIENIKKDIEVYKNETSKFYTEIKNISNNTMYFNKKSITSLDDFLSFQIYNFDIGISPHLKNDLHHLLSKRRNDLLKTRARLAISAPQMEKDRRKCLLTELQGIGDKTDIENLNTIINNTDEENLDIRQHAEYIQSFLKDKFKSSIEMD